MPVPENNDRPVAELSFKLFGDEALRFREVFKRARVNDHEVDRTDVIKFLLYLPTKRKGFLTNEDRRYFQAGDRNSGSWGEPGGTDISQADLVKPSRKVARKK